MFLSKYGVARHIYVPVVKRAVVDFAIGADWTPAAGDVKISKDGGAFANVTNLPTAIASANTGAVWDFSLTATEMQAAQVVVVVSDAATKAIEDQTFIVETYGNASAQHPFDLATATPSVNLAANAVNAAAINANTGLIIRTGTAQAGAASTITLDAGASATTDFYKGAQVVITGGTGAGQHRIISAYNGGTKVATVAEAWATNPDVTSTFALLPTRTYVEQLRATVIGSANFATDAIDANALAANAATEIRDAVWALAMTELANVPGVTATVLQALEWVFLVQRNKLNQTATTATLRNDADNANIGQAGVSDDGTTFTRNKYA